MKKDRIYTLSKTLSTIPFYHAPNRTLEGGLNKKTSDFLLKIRGFTLFEAVRTGLEYTS